VEVSRQKNPRENVEWFALLNHSGQLGNGFHEPLPLHNIKISFKPGKPVRSIRRLTDGKSLHYQQGTDNQIELILPELNSFDIILIEY
jgi:hypothetical protein